jgi:hypothetical protein
MGMVCWVMALAPAQIDALRAAPRSRPIWWRWLRASSSGAALTNTLKPCRRTNGNTQRAQFEAPMRSLSARSMTMFMRPNCATTSGFFSLLCDYIQKAADRGDGVLIWISRAYHHEETTTKARLVLPTGRLRHPRPKPAKLTVFCNPDNLPARAENLSRATSVWPRFLRS